MGMSEGEKLYRKYRDDGIIIVHRNEVFGRAADGILVRIGDTDNMECVFLYLEDRGGPDNW